MSSISTVRVVRRPSSRRPGAARALRVLVCATVSARIVAALHSEDSTLDIQSCVVEDPQRLSDHLGDAWDALIVDESAPGWSVQRVIEPMRARGVTPPVVVICDPSREGLGALTVDRRAADWLASDRLARLPAAVRAAVARAAVEQRLARVEAALAGAESLLRAAFTSAATAVIAVDPDGRVTEWNPAAERLLGWASAEACGRDLLALVTSDREREQLGDVIAAAAVSDVPKQGVEPMAVRRRDGEELRVAVWASHRYGDVTGVVLALDDSTAAWRSEQLRSRRIAFLRTLDFVTGDHDLPEVLHQLALAAEASAASLWESEAQGAVRLRARWADPGGPESGVAVASSTPPVLVEQACATAKVALAGAGTAVPSEDGVGFHLAVPVIRGEKLWGAVEMSGPVAPPLDDDLVIHLLAAAGQLGGYLSRRRTEGDLARSLEELRRSDGERRRLVRLLVQAHEDERHAIAADIHDDPLQVMAAVGLRLHTLRRRIDGTGNQQIVEAVEEMVSGAVSRLRGLMFNLRPPGLDHGDLMGPLRDRLEVLRQDDSIDWRITGTEPSAMTTEGRVTLYRIAQEAIANVVKHASATILSVDVSEQGGGCLMKITDDGAGIRDGVEGRPGHLGLPAMRERAELVGGWVRVESAPGTGTAVIAWIPLPSEPGRVGEQGR